MKPTTKKILAYSMFAVVMALVYLVIGFTVDVIFRWCGDEEGISITSTMITCLVFTTAIVLAEIARNRQMGIDRSDELIRKCRKFLSATVIMFLGFMVMDMLFEHFSEKDYFFGPKYWLSFSIASGIIDLLYERYKEKKHKNDENDFVVAAECPDVQSAESICNRLEANGIKAMVVEKESPIYIKGSIEYAEAQVQVCRKDLQKAQELNN